MRDVFRLYENMKVTTKFITIYLSILIVSLTFSGFILYVQASQATISQAQTVMEQNLLQTKDSISQKVNMIENISQIIAFDTKIQTFLGSAFINESFQLEDYRYNIAPILDNMMRQNTYIHSIRIFMENDTIPELYDGFYSMKRINNKDGYREFIANQAKQSGWRNLHLAQMMAQIPGTAAADEVFSYDRKIFSTRYFDLAGMLEIEVKQDVLFDTLKDSVSDDLGNIFVIDQEGTVVSGNIPALQNKQIADLGIPELPVDRKVNQIQDVRSIRSLVISIPLQSPGLRIVGVFPISHFTGKVTESMKTTVIILLSSLAALSLIVYLITTKLLSRMKILLRAMKQVREGSLDVSVPVVANDEFTQMAISFNHMTSRIHDLVETVYKSEIMEKEAELRALEAQINPHFLYNTLATISWVARKANAPEITHLSQSLAKVYRLVLNKGSSEMTVYNEIEMVKAYLQIQKFRFEDRFDVVFEVDEQVSSLFMTKNILQPLVENALSHGIEPKRFHGTIIIKAGLQGERLFFQVIDDGVGMRPDKVKEILEGRVEKTSGSGYAVKNMMDRLQSYYGDQHSLAIFSRPGIGTVVTITFAMGRGSADA
jgi:two-component system sensor histidine kinase YesM